MGSKAQSGYAENRVVESHPSDGGTELEDQTIEQEILQVLHESVVRYGGAGQVSVRTVSRVVSKRKGLKNNQSLMRSVRDVLENLSWASLWGNGYQGSKRQGHLGARIYALEMGPAELARVKEQLIQRGPVRTPGSVDFRNLRKRILQTLSEEFPRSPKELAEHLKEAYTRIQGQLNRLVKRGELVRPKTGFYCFPDQLNDARKRIEEKQSGDLVRVRHGLYCLTSQVKSREPQSIRNRSREIAIAAMVSHSRSKNDQTQSRTGNSTIAKAMAQVLQLLLDSPRMTPMQIVGTTGMTESTISKATERLMDLSILVGDESGQVSIAPQKDPETIRMIQMVGEKGLDEAIRALVVEYLQRKLDKTQKRVFNMRQLKKHVKERLQVLTAWEFRREMAPMLESFTSNGVIESLDGDIYRFSPSVVEAST